MKICITCEGISELELENCAHCGTCLLSTAEVHFPLRRGEEDAGHPLVGQVVDGKYRLLNVVGKGGMGTVFRAEHEISQVPVAVKVLHPRHAALADHRAWFLAEARKAGRVVHEHTARILDVGETVDGTVFIAMELVPGVDLSTWLANDGQFGDGQSGGGPSGGGPSGDSPSGEMLASDASAEVPVDVTVDVLAQMARALSAAHQAGVVHRDLTSRNVMVSLRDGRPFVKILDFGIAKGAGFAGASGGDRTPIGFATPPYSAPEHLEGRDVDGRADLYSLGVIAFEMLAGRPPVNGTTATDMIQATLDGDLDLPRSIPGVPAELLALVVSLLARDPAARPDSALRVAQRFEQMLEPRGRHLAAVAIVMAVSVVLVFALLGTPRTTVGLAIAGDDPSLVVFPFKPLVPTVQELQSQDLAKMRFRFRGFDPDGLQVEVRRDGLLLWRSSLGARVDESSGELILSTHSPDYLAFIDRLGKTAVDRAVDLEFVTADGDQLGFARLILDDAAPEVHLKMEPQGPVITGLTRLQLTQSDRGTLTKFELVIELQAAVGGSSAAVKGPSNPLRHSFDLGAVDLDLSALDVLGPHYSGVVDRGPGQMWLEARDSAGNEAESGRVHFRVLDLRAPNILAAPLGGSDLTYLPDGVRLRANLSAFEDDLEFQLLGPDGRALSTSARRVDSVYELDVAYGQDRLFASGAYLLSLSDSHGNRSADFAMNLRFRSAELSARLMAQADRAQVYWLVDQKELVTDGSAILLDFTCSDLYTPIAVLVSERKHDAVVLRDAQSGHADVAIGLLPDGDYSLEFEFSSEQSEDPPRQSYGLRVLGARMELHVPMVRGTRYLRELEDDSVLRVSEGSVSQGPGWRLSPPDARLLRGLFWVGDPPVEKIPMPARSDANEDLLDGFVLRRGLNCISAELRDVFGRPIRVLRSGVERKIVPSSSGGQIQELVRFLDHDAPIEAVDSVLRVEHDQATRVQIRSALPLKGSDVIELRVPGTTLLPESVMPDGDGAVLTFELPFAQIAALPGVGGISEEQFVVLPEFPLAVRLRCPAGEYPLSFIVQPIRTSLVPVRLATLGAEVSDPALSGIWMVPIAGLPERGEYLDPVPASVGQRRAFRLAPATTVRNIGDYYLQEGELTRGQYQALVDAGLAKADLRARWQRFVHAADPLGASRLQALELVPRVYAEDPDAWRRARRVGANRPVTGVDFFQAYTLTRLAGEVLKGDADLFRLPTGIELEYAAYGQGEGKGALRLHRGDVSAEGFHSAATDLSSFNPARWPLTSEESERIGDLVHTSPESSTAIIGLDFGVREWVIDLPFAAAAGDAALTRRTLMMREWLGEHARLVRRAEALARGALPVADLPADLATHFSRFGVVRGLASGELRGLKSGVDGRVQAWKTGKLEAEIPGVVRELTIRRDGTGLLPGRLDRHLRLCGFRLAAGSRFIAEVRKR